MVLFLGMDAAGKDHIANILTGMIEERGLTVEKRRSFFCGRRSVTKDSSKKTIFAKIRQKLFLSLHGPFAPFVPPALNWLMQRDVRHFVPPKSKLVVVGHHPIKALGFYLAQTGRGSQDFTIPRQIEKTLRQMNRKTNAHVVMVDVDEKIRAQRVAQRIKAGQCNDLDLFIQHHPKQAKLIEEKMIYVAQEIFGGVRLTNNNLSLDEIKEQLFDGFARRQNKRVACPSIHSCQQNGVML